MRQASNAKSIMAKFLGFFLAIAMVFTMMPISGNMYTYAAENQLTLQTPEVVVTGSAVIGNDGTYSASNVGYEKSYTRDQLKEMVANGAGGTDVLYSAQKTKEPYTKLLYRATGVWVTSLLDGTAYDASTDVLQLIASDGYVTSFDPARTELQGTKINGLNVPRYAFPGIMTGDEADAQEVPAMLAYASTEDEVMDPQTAGAEKNQLTLHIGQETVTEHNNGAYAKKIKNVVGGNAISEIALTVGSDAYTRADVLAMPYAERTFEYTTTSDGKVIDNVKGVPMSVLLDGYNDKDVVNFEAADGYAVAASGLTVKQLIDGNFILAYEVNGKGLYSTKKKDPSVYGFFNLYGDGDAYAKPAKMVNKITVTSGDEGIDFSTSPYTHITNGGQPGSAPYNIDAITGATLTVEGPGVKSSVPLPVRDLEGQNKGAVRGIYTDTRDGVETTRSYEGIDLYYILNNMQNGANGIILTDAAKKVEIKNRNRKTIATLTIDEINAMHEAGNPAIVAYGTANEDGTNVRPFVFNGATGEDLDLGNNDGCLKLVCDLDSIDDKSYTTFGNMAYIYVEEDTTPGFKHDKEPYNHKDNTKYIVTLTGDKMGKEALYTVEQLEDMVTYDANGNVDASGIGYRDDYSLANSTYWYVNTYEGVKLWDLLVKSGLDADLANDDSVKVTFGSTDNYTGFDTFTTKQLADPNNFKFYEKNAADLNDGKYESTDEADLIKAGYPVLLSYGVNGYPYVKSSKLDGYLSGLQNDGGPLRVIWGKTAYNHANGSNQAKLVDRIFVGGNTYHYATHKYTDAAANPAQSALQNNTITVNIYNGDGADATLIKSKEYTVGDIEKIIYDGNLTANQKKVAAVKNFYEATKGGVTYSDIYEGINLNYFLENVVELPGAEGTISFNGSDGQNLSDVLAITDGVNSTEGISGLTPVLAYGKNGYPLMADKGEGFVKAANNNNGPLQVIIPSAKAGDNFYAYNSVTEISINLNADKYAHVNTPYDQYKDNTLEISGEGARNAVTLTVAELEGKQKLAQTTTFSIGKNKKGTVSETYRGFNLYNLLSSTTVGLKSSANGVKITDTAGGETEFTMDQIRQMYKNTLTDEDVPVMLAYGINIDGTEYPLVPDRDSDGYEYGVGKVVENHGGPLKLIIGQTAADENNGQLCIKNVAKIEITAAETDSWAHNSGVFTQYLDMDALTLQVVDNDNNELFNKTYTTAELEAMTSLVERADVMTTSMGTWEGLNLWKFVLQEAGSIDGVSNPVSVTAVAKDGFSKELRSIFGLDALENGVQDGTTYVPILLAYARNGYPLVPGGGKNGGTPGEGYDATIGNDGGPIKLATHLNQGAALSETRTIVVKVGASAPETQPGDFTIAGSVDKVISLEDLSKNEAVEASYICKGDVIENVKGIALADLLKANGIDVETTKITLNATDNYEKGEGSYRNITLTDAIAQNYFVAWEEKNADGEYVPIHDVNKDGSETYWRIYRNYNEAIGVTKDFDWRNKCTGLLGITVDIPEVVKFKTLLGGKELPLAGIRSVSKAADGSLWIGTYGQGIVKLDSNKAVEAVYNTTSTPALKTDVVSAVCVDKDGGVWFSQNASYEQPEKNEGVGYLKDGEITYFSEADGNTIPNNYVQEIKIDANGNVWFGSFAGLTKYDPKANTWQTWGKAEGFPAASIDNIEFDGNGGIWCGFYPEGAGTAADPFTGGFAYFKDGVITCPSTYQYTAAYDEASASSMLAQVWIRDIAVDKDGGAWIVASGSRAGMTNEGGTVWYVSAPGEKPLKYSGAQLLGDALNGADNAEVRMVACDADGGLWLGTSADGIIYVKNPTVGADYSMNVTAEYSKETGSWDASLNNIYSLDIIDDVVIAGSANGLAWKGGLAKSIVYQSGSDEPDDPEEPTKEVIGDPNMADLALTITGDGALKDAYFSIKSLKNEEHIAPDKSTDKSFNWKNKSGTEGVSVVQGADIDVLLKDVIGLDENVSDIEFIAADGYKTVKTPEELFVADKNGRMPVLAWKQDGENCNPILVIGQQGDEVNRSNWARDIVKIVINKAEAPEPPAKEVIGDPNMADLALTITGEGAVRDGYFSVKSLKNEEHISPDKSTDKTFTWKNSSGSEGTTVVQGANMDVLLKDVIGITDKATDVDFISSDNRVTNVSIENLFKPDKNGMVPVLAWKEDGVNCDLKLVIGQQGDEVNKGKWAKNVVKIVVNETVVVVDPEAEAINGEITKIDIDNITLDDEEALNELVKQYAALTDEQKAQVEDPQKLVDAVNKIAETKQVIAETKEEIALTEENVNYKDYAADDMIYLWIMAQKAEKAIANAKSEAEAQAIMDEYMQAIMDAPSKFTNSKMTIEAATSYSFDSIEVTWEAKEGAASYDIYRANSKSGKYEKVGESTGTSFIDSELPTGKTRYYKVKAVDNFNHYSAFSGKKYAKALPYAPEIIAVNSEGTSATVDWTAVDGATGYRVYYKRAKAKAKYVNVTTPEQLETVVNKLKANKDYNFKVRAYTKVGKTKYYGKWSTIVTKNIEVVQP